MVNKYKNVLVWFRRDLRVRDNRALLQALKEGDRVFCCFVFDTNIIKYLSDPRDRRIHYIWGSVAELKSRICSHGGELYVTHGKAEQEILNLSLKLDIDALFFAEDYEPYAIKRDDMVTQSLTKLGKKVFRLKDQVIMAKDEVMSPKGTPYSVYTPYKNAWLKKVASKVIPDTGKEKIDWKNLAFDGKSAMPTLPDLGFAEFLNGKPAVQPGESSAQSDLLHFSTKIDQYEETRNYPFLDNTSRLSVHLRFGTVSIRDLFRLATSKSTLGHKAWLNELIWRDFYFSILSHFPYVTDRSFKIIYDQLEFTNNQTYFDAWCTGKTGYPIVDAGMRQLNETGYMHNRLRMVTASFLVKDLQVDWRWGEKYFADKLTDFDLSANNGGWQWAASTGCDAQPYFRIFNPSLQSKRFDGEGTFIKKYVTELSKVPMKFIHSPWLMDLQNQKQYSCLIGTDYPYPVVDHSEMRDSSLLMYKQAREKEEINRGTRKQ